MVAHDILLRGLQHDRRPTILQRTDQEFVAALLQELGAPDGVARVLQSVAAARLADGTLKLYQPVHRTFHLVLLEALCDPIQNDRLSRLGEPRLESSALVAGGLVVRRPARGGHAAWLSDGARQQGWVRLADEDQDPDPAQRRPALSTGIVELDAQLGIGRTALSAQSESVTPLFVAPPALCSAAGKTILYGLIPVASAERSAGERTDPFNGRELALADLRTIFGPFLDAGSRAVPLRLDGQNQLLLDFARADKQLIGLLRRLIGLDTLENGPEAAAFMAALDGVALAVDPAGLSPVVTAPFEQTGHGLQAPAGAFLRRFAAMLRDSAQDPTEITSSATGASVAWRLTQAQSDQILTAAGQLLQARAAALKIGQGEKRFRDDDTRYQLRAFARVRRMPDCPPELVWSAYSEPFTIAPWHDTNPAVPPLSITLPDVSDRAALKRLKPNVSFVMPQSLHDLINQSPARFLDDQNAAMGSNSLTIQWVCSFSLPIITLCAFIVLNIFLSLFNFVFNWLMFVKLCLPIPLPGAPESES